MNNTTLGSVVRSLHLREIDNVTAHGSSGNEATVGEVSQLVAVDVGTLLLLTTPMRSGSPGTVECAVQINVHNVTVVLDGPINHWTLGPGDTGVGNENIQSAIEILDHCIRGLLDGLGIGDLDLVGLGCGKMIKFQSLFMTNTLSNKSSCSYLPWTPYF